MAALLVGVFVLALSAGPLVGTAAATPVLLTPPRITHNAWLAQTLTLTPGTYTNAASVADAWFSCSDPQGTNCLMPSDFTSTYLLGNGEVGRYIKVTETATAPAPDMTTTVVDSNVTFQVAAQAPTLQTAAAISDTTSGTSTVQQGDTLTATDGTWSEPPDSVRRQWERCNGSTCTPIAGETSATYTTTQADVGDTIQLSEAPTYGPTTLGSATSAATRVVQTTSTVSLTAAPSAPVTNQRVTLVATVTSQAAAGSPSGSVAFLDNGKPVSGCGAQPVTASAQSATVLCQTSFAAESAQLTATFTPVAGSLVLGSSSAGQTLPVGKAMTTTALDASSPVPVNASTTYTATVAPAADGSGPITPSGSVQFLNGGKPIAACVAKPLSGGGATCTVKYTSTGSRSISARYVGDANFTGSGSTARAVQVTALLVKGTITATMQWTFVYTPTYTRVINLVVNGVSTGATVRALCHGRGCPFAKRSRTIGKPKRCSRKHKHSCPVPGRIALTSAFRHHNLRPGAQITIEIRRPQYVGKYYSFTVRPQKQPRVRIACLAVNATRPSGGC